MDVERPSLQRSLTYKETARAIEKTRGQSRNQLTLPKEVRRASGSKAGDTVLIRATGPGTIEVRGLPRMTFEESLAKYRVDACVDPMEMQQAIEEASSRLCSGR